MARDELAVAVAAAKVRAQVDQQANPQPNPVQSHDAPRKDDKIRQGRPRHENGANQRPDPEGPGEVVLPQGWHGMTPRPDRTFPPDVKPYRDDVVPSSA
jgi:hypothetical protein